MEAFKYLEKASELIKDHIDNDIESASNKLSNLGEVAVATLEDKDCKSVIKKLKTKLEKFTKEWNEDENNRDKTYTAFKSLKNT